MKSMIFSLLHNFAKTVLTLLLVQSFMLSAIGQMPVDPDPDGQISVARQKALEIYTRLVGVKVPIDHPDLVSMEALVAQGKLVEAAAVATSKEGFYDVTVRDFAARMSTREETVKAPISDFVATIVGATRDDLDARTLLYQDYYYKAAAGTDGVTAMNLVNDILKSNNHYNQLNAAIDNRRTSLMTSLEKVDGQSLLNGAGAAVAHRDPSGILTSRAFMQAHAVAGTNRRLVEYTMRQFACQSIEGWSSTSASDSMVGRDVDRYPGGSAATYLSTCKGCHSVMDSFRPAFAYVDWEDANNERYVKHGQVLESGKEGVNRIETDGNGVVLKMNRLADTFPGGYVINDNKWKNHAIEGSNDVFFGWREASMSGQGISDFGRAVAGSKAFSRCMVKRVYRSVCKRETSKLEVDSGWIQKIAGEFEGSGGRKLKWLFARLATDEQCMGKD